MAVITIPKEAAEVGGNLFDLVYNGSVLNSEVADIIAGTNRIIDDTNASPSQKLIIDEAGILEILAEGGKIEDYLFGIKQPSSSVSLDVPEGVPLRLFKGGGVRNFLQWFANNAQTWINNVTDEIMYYTDPNPSGVSILKASEAKIIKDIDPINYTFYTIAEVQEIVKPGGIPDPDWQEI